MIRQIKSLVRSFIKKPVYTSITFIGFTMGIAAGLLIFLWVNNELSYEKFHPGYHRIYRVLTLAKEGGEVVKSAGCYRPVAKTLKMAYPEIESATYLSFDSEDSPLTKTKGGEKIEARRISTNEDFFKIFGGFTFIEGSPDRAFSNPDNTVLSEEVAKKLFGGEPALGKTVISDKYETELYTVSGVVRIPEQSHIDFGFILPESNRRYSRLADNWGDKSLVHVYIRLAENAAIDKPFLEKITNHLSRFSRSSDKLMFQPLTDIHLYTDYETYLYDKNISSYKYVLIFTGFAMIIILMAALNFSVLSVARSSERSKEIGIKKVYGAGRLKIIREFMGETVLQTMGASVLALFIVGLILPWFNTFTGQNLAFGFSPGFLLSLGLLVLMVGIVAGVYPSLYLSSLQPMRIFRGGSRTGSKTGFTRLLVVIQFSIATFFIIATFVFAKQLSYIQHKELGFDRKNIVVIPTGLWYDSKNFKNELLQNPNILSVSATTCPPAGFDWQESYAVKRADRIDSFRASILWVDEDFAKTYRLQITRGEFLRMDFSGFWKEVAGDTGMRVVERKGLSLPVVINETAEKILGFNNPIGERIGDYVIVGVVKDFHFRTLQYPIGPLFMANDPQNIMTMNIRIADKNRSETLKFIKNIYLKNRNSRSFSYNYFDDLLSRNYLDEFRLRNLVILFSIVAVVISMMGILGMSVFACDRRTKEIGIRKVNGASTSRILLMLNRDFLKWVFIAFLCAAPIAWYLLHRWLGNFAYRTELSWWVFISAAGIVLLLAFIAINWQVIRLALKNPVDALRYE